MARFEVLVSALYRHFAVVEVEATTASAARQEAATMLAAIDRGTLSDDLLSSIDTWKLLETWHVSRGAREVSDA